MFKKMFVFALALMCAAFVSCKKAEKKAVGLSAPWCVHAEKIKALFSQDSDVTVDYDDTHSEEIILYVDGSAKAEAIQTILGNEVRFGKKNALKITVVPSNRKTEPKATLLETALNGNNAFVGVIRGSGQTPFSFDYAGFRKEVVQFFVDDLSDPNGNYSGCWHDVARDILIHSDIGNFYVVAD